MIEQRKLWYPKTKPPSDPDGWAILVAIGLILLFVLACVFSRRFME